jgi:hypothetical protein
LIDSDPALCSAHAGRNVGAGAPVGNQNGMKHGLYASMMKPEEVADLEIATTSTLVHELVMTRLMLRRMARYLNKEELPQKDAVEIMSIIFTGVRAVAYLRNNIEKDAVDWDGELDDLGKAWGMEL